MNLQLLATLWPSFPHFDQFKGDSRLAGIRLNPAMITWELEAELALLNLQSKPFFFDVKSRQMRVETVYENDSYLDIILNHAISVETPTAVLFKAGADVAILDHIEEDGRRLIFQGGPQYSVYAGESIHIRHPSLQVHEPIFTVVELDKVDKAKKVGFTRWFLSYVECQDDVDQFLELVGHDAEVWLKIESPRGLRYARSFNKKDTPNLTLVAARGDLYVELARPHNILPALKLLIQADPEACVGSRLLLSLCSGSTAVTKLLAGQLQKFGVSSVEAKKLAQELFDPVPACADWHELAWLYDIGYRRFMLCDELCLEGNLLGTAINAFEAFRTTYCKDR